MTHQIEPLVLWCVRERTVELGIRLDPYSARFCDGKHSSFQVERHVHQNGGKRRSEGRKQMKH